MWLVSGCDCIMWLEEIFQGMIYSVLPFLRVTFPSLLSSEFIKKKLKLSSVSKRSCFAVNVI